MHRRPAWGGWLGLCCACLLAAAESVPASVFAASGAASAGGGAQEKKQELDGLRARIEKLQRDLGKSEESRSEVADQLKTSERAISEVNRSLNALLKEQSSLGKELSQLSAKRTVAAAALAREKALLEQNIRYQYMHGNTDALRLMLSGEDVGDVERRLAYLGYVSKTRAEAIAATKKAAALLAEVEAETKSKRDQVSSNAAEQTKARQALEKERANRRQVMQRIQTDIARNRREIGRLKRDEERLTKLVEQLARVIAEQSANRAEQRRRRSTPDAPQSQRRPGEVIDSAADEAFVGRAFTTLKGKLKLPVKGELVGRFGGSREEAGVTWKGLFIRAQESSPVRAVADGRVVYADWLRGYGNILILDHGNGYLSLYGGNESILKNVGDNVKSGDVVASVGSTGGYQEPGVYFELRQDGKPFDPMRWVAR